MNHNARLVAGRFLRSHVCDLSLAKKNWQTAMGVLSEDEYLQKNGYRAIVVASNFVRDVGTAAFEQKYTQVSSAIKDGSWRAIYARTDAEFNSIVADVIAQAKGLGYDECIAWDVQQGQRRIAAVRPEQRPLNQPIECLASKRRQTNIALYWSNPLEKDGVKWSVKAAGNIAAAPTLGVAEDSGLYARSVNRLW